MISTQARSRRPWSRARWSSDRGSASRAGRPGSSRSLRASSDRSHLRPLAIVAFGPDLDERPGELGRVRSEDQLAELVDVDVVELARLGLVELLARDDVGVSAGVVA